MKTRRIIAIAIAIIVAVLIIYAGRSCAQNIAENNKNNAIPGNTTPTSSGTNGFDSLTYPTYVQQTMPVTETTDNPNVQNVTNTFGEVIGTVPVTTSEPALSPETPTESQTTGVSILDRDETSAEETAPAPPAEAPTEATTADSKHPLLGNSASPESNGNAQQTSAYTIPSEIVIQLN